ncbi:MAG: S1 RNA-binding domain-containing protein [Planctomycetes bacterium]|nr:S1 RNA-binding domain-containing protein [Planctomycetota bacterium]
MGTGSGPCEPAFPERAWGEERFRAENTEHIRRIVGLAAPSALADPINILNGFLIGITIMANDSDKPPETPSPNAKPAEQPAGAPAKAREKHKFFPKPGGPRQRVRDAVPSLESDLLYKPKVAPNVHDLDAEIADELEAALQGMDDAKLYAADSSQRARSQAVAGESGRKIGTVISVHAPDVFVEIPGGRSQGVLTLEHFPDGPPAVGSQVEVSIEGYDPQNGLLILSRLGAAVHADWSSVAEGMTVEARVLESNKGGLAVDVNGIRGFMPISQIDRFRVENIEQFVNQKLICIVTEVDKEARNLVVSRRAVLEKERDEQREKLWTELEEGQIRSGVVGNVRDFGAFVDLGGVDGLLHVSEISWKRVADATQVLQVGQMVKVVVLKLDRENRKISLGLKQLEASPWDNIEERFTSGQTVKGTVSRTMDFGAFVELEPGVEGLIHVSELARGRVWRVSDVVKSGQEVEVKILSVDAEAKRISLSLREALPPEIVKSEDDEEEDTGPAEPVKPRVRNYPLKGGIGGSAWIGENDKSGE